MRVTRGACSGGFTRYDPAKFKALGHVLAMTTPPPEVIVVDKHRIACDGGGGALGHPRVFLEMGTGAQVECPYCDRKFVLSKTAAEAGHH